MILRCQVQGESSWEAAPIESENEKTEHTDNDVDELDEKSCSYIYAISCIGMAVILSRTDLSFTKGMSGLALYEAEPQVVPEITEAVKGCTLSLHCHRSVTLSGLSHPVVFQVKKVLLTLFAN